jgi:hypothetical protein
MTEAVADAEDTPVEAAAGPIQGQATSLKLKREN